MSTTSWIVPYKHSVTLNPGSCQRSSGSASIRSPTHLSAVSESMNGRQFQNPGDRGGLIAFSGTIGRVPGNTNTRRYMAVYCSSQQPGASPPSGDSTNLLKNWILGALFSLVVPLWKYQLGPLLKLKNEVETAVETTEQIAEAIGSVAEEVEKVADEIGNQLPQGKLKDAAEWVENLAKETAKDAHLVDDAIEKVKESEKKVDELVEDVERVGDDLGQAAGNKSAQQQ